MMRRFPVLIRPVFLFSRICWMKQPFLCISSNVAERSSVLVTKYGFNGGILLFFSDFFFDIFSVWYKLGILLT